MAFTKRSSIATPDGYAEFNNFADYLADTAKPQSCLPGAGLAVDEMDAVGDKVFIKYRFFADPIPPAPNGLDSYFLSVFHLDPAGSGLVVGNDEWIDNIAAEPYVGASTPTTFRSHGAPQHREDQWSCSWLGSWCIPPIHRTGGRRSW